jgi:16S rRNA processing protein RimM
MPPAAPSHTGPSRVCLGEIVAPHGVRGLVRVRSFTEDPEALTRYGPLTDQAGVRRYALALLSPHRGQWLARVEGVADRDGALELRGTRLYVDRAALPPPDEDEEYYQADLIGLAAERPDGTAFGTVRAVHDFGAGDVLEIVPPPGSGAAGSVMLPFTRAAVPVVDLPGGRLVVDPPPGLFDDAGAAGDEERGRDAEPEPEAESDPAPERRRASA